MVMFYNKTVNQILSMGLELEDEQKAIGERYELLKKACDDIIYQTSQLAELLEKVGGDGDLVSALARVNDIRRQEFGQLVRSLEEPSLFFSGEFPEESDIKKWEGEVHEFKKDNSRKLEDFLTAFLEGPLGYYLVILLAPVRTELAETRDLSNLFV